MLDDRVVLIMMPDIRTYPEPPKDQANCSEHLCPLCKKETWLSAKKRHFIASKVAPTFLACYACIEKQLKIKSNFFEQPKEEAKK